MWRGRGRLVVGIELIGDDWEGLGVGCEEEW